MYRTPAKARYSKDSIGNLFRYALGVEDLFYLLPPSFCCAPPPTVAPHTAPSAWAVPLNIQRLR